jgi:nitroreductase
MTDRAALPATTLPATGADTLTPGPGDSVPEVVDFLLTRRSRPAKTLSATGPDRASLMTLLTAASRCPDHGKLEPWRFVVIEDAARARIAGLAQDRAAALGQDTAGAEKTAAPFGMGALTVAVIASPKPSAKIPEWEQHAAAACVCLGLVNASLASGWGANWLTGPLARDAVFGAAALDLATPEFVMGFVVIGGETLKPADRDRPDVAGLTCWA